MLPIVQFFNILAKLGIFKKFFNANPKTGASAGVTLVLTIVTSLFGYLGWGITQDQALEISEGIAAIGGMLMIHFAPSPMKAK